MTLLLLFIALAIGVSFVCSVLEAVLLSITPSYVAAQEVAKPQLAGRLKALKAQVDRPLAAILSLNTVAHTVGAAGAGAQAAIVFGEAWLAVFSAVLTFLILVLSEIIPKSLGARYWRTLTPVVAHVLPLLMTGMWPLVKMSEGISRLMGGNAHAIAVSREEIAALARVGAAQGVVADSELRIVRNLLRFSALCARDIMTPRTVVFALAADTTVKALIDEIDKVRFSRIPIYENSIDDASAFVLKTEILLQGLRGDGAARLGSLARPLLIVPEDMALDRLFEQLMENEQHIALVRDEFGGTAGVVSLEDLVETLLGLEIVDEADTTADLQALAREQWALRARRLGLLPPAGAN